MRSPSCHTAVPMILAALCAFGGAACHDWTTPDQPDAAGTDCETQAHEVAQLRKAAKTCTPGLYGCTALMDECGCTTNISDSTETSTPYKNAIEQLASAGCSPLDCPADCPEPDAGECSFSGTGFSCLP